MPKQCCDRYVPVTRCQRQDRKFYLHVCLYSHPYIRSIFGFHSVTRVPLQQIIWNLYMKSGPIQRMTSLISNFTPFYIMQLCPCLFKLSLGEFMSYGHVLPFLWLIYNGLAPVIFMFDLQRSSASHFNIHHQCCINNKSFWDHILNVIILV